MKAISRFTYDFLCHSIEICINYCWEREKKYLYLDRGSIFSFRKYFCTPSTAEFHNIFSVCSFVCLIFCLSGFPFVWFYVCLIFRMSDFPFVWFSVCLIFRLPDFPFVWFSVCLIFRLSDFPYDWFSVCQIFRLSDFPFVWFSACLIPYLSFASVLWTWCPCIGGEGYKHKVYSMNIRLSLTFVLGEKNWKSPFVFSQFLLCK